MKSVYWYYHSLILHRRTTTITPQSLVKNCHKIGQALPTLYMLSSCQPSWINAKSGQSHRGWLNRDSLGRLFQKF